MPESRVYTFYVPAGIGHWRFSELRVSRGLLAVLKRMGVCCLDDLNGVSLRDFRRVSKMGSELALEVGRIIRMLDEGDPVSQARMIGSREVIDRGNRTNRPAKNLQLSAPPPQKRVRRKGTAQRPNREPANASILERLAVSPTETPQQNREVIFIPLAARGEPVSAHRLSTRLAKLLQYKNVKLLGDLQGARYDELLKWRGCGLKTVDELREIVRQLQPSEGSGTATCAAEAGPSQPVDLLLIPGHSRRVRISDLNISVRLANCLAAWHIERLGDLHGHTLRDFSRRGIFGKNTKSELLRISERARAGEFNPSPVDLASLQPPQVLPLLDTLIAGLRDRNRSIFGLRFGASEGQTVTLRETSSQFELTRERVRQIIEKSLGILRKTGGVRLHHLLGRISVECCDGVYPITPELLATWLRVEGTQTTFHPTFYLRVLASLSPEIPIWPTGPESGRQNGDLDEDIERLLTAGLKDGRRSLPLKKVFQSLRRNRRLKKLTPLEFLDAIRSSSRFRVNFARPQNPEIRPNRAGAAGFAKAVRLAGERALVSTALPDARQQGSVLEAED